MSEKPEDLVEDDSHPQYVAAKKALGQAPSISLKEITSAYEGLKCFELERLQSVVKSAAKELIATDPSAVASVLCSRFRALQNAFRQPPLQYTIRDVLDRYSIVLSAFGFDRYERDIRTRELKGVLADTSLEARLFAICQLQMRLLMRQRNIALWLMEFDLGPGMPAIRDEAVPTITHLFDVKQYSAKRDDALRKLESCSRTLTRWLQHGLRPVTAQGSAPTSVDELLLQHEYAPNDTQIAILKLLKGTSLTAKLLSTKVGVHETNIRKAIRPLQKLRIIRNKRGRGYFRCDDRPLG